MPTGQGKTWTAHRVSSVRRVHGIHAYRSAEKNGEWLTMSEAATTLGVTHHRIRRLIKDGILSAEQVVPGAPYQIRAADLQDERVAAAIGPNRSPVSRRAGKTNFQCFQRLEEEGHNERLVAMPRSARSAALFDQADPPVVEKAGEGRPALEHVVDRLGASRRGATAWAAPRAARLPDRQRAARSIPAGRPAAVRRSGH